MELRPEDFMDEEVFILFTIILFISTTNFVEHFS